MEQKGNGVNQIDDQFFLIHDLQVSYFTVKRGVEESIQELVSSLVPGHIDQLFFADVVRCEDKCWNQLISTIVFKFFN